VAQAACEVFPDNPYPHPSPAVAATAGSSPGAVVGDRNSLVPLTLVARRVVCHVVYKGALRPLKGQLAGIL
jgi:hypothetical protein